jgi:hypothetical protein
MTNLDSMSMNSRVQLGMLSPIALLSTTNAVVEVGSRTVNLAEKRAQPSHSCLGLY